METSGLAAAPGLYMYDGKSVTHYTEKEGLEQDNVNTILEAKNGILWIGSFAGITRYDGKTFSHFGGGNTHSIKEDKTGIFGSVDMVVG
jgi:ligand-binding sensor domain-containing protein